MHSLRSYADQLEPTASYVAALSPWLARHGPRQLELLTRAIDSLHPDRPIPGDSYALCLLDSGGYIVSWYAGAARIYRYRADESIHQHLSFLHSGDPTTLEKVTVNLKHAAAQGHITTEEWHVAKEGSRFWANVIILALKDDKGGLQGFAMVVRDFSDRHDKDERLARGGAPLREPTRWTVAGIVSGELDRPLEMNDAFLKLSGYSREDLLTGHLRWSALVPPDHAALDEMAHEESLQFGACTPYQKDVVRKDGARVPVLVATAMLQICPFRWITFVQDLRQRERKESAPEQAEGFPRQDFDEIVGSSAVLKHILRQAEMVAPTDATVLILGETGTGKELIARAVHRLSPRNHHPFITLNCAAIPTGLLESELFGYERGAFTGALSQKIGRFELAHRGTLFLDEVGDIPLDLQPKLLRALQEKSFERLGGTKTIPIDVRLLAATNRDLTQMMEDKLFRNDLYYRLKVFPITMPPLRERPEDIPVLTWHFTRKYAAMMNRPIEQIPSETMQALVRWHWPGNVRELENFLERAVILSRGPRLRAPLDELSLPAVEAPRSTTLEQVQREHIVRILVESGGVVTSAATRLGLHRTTLNAMMRKLGISRGNF